VTLGAKWKILAFIAICGAFGVFGVIAGSNKHGNGGGIVLLVAGSLALAASVIMAFLVLRGPRQE
jgi:hypothetical protein